MTARMTSVMEMGNVVAPDRRGTMRLRRSSNSLLKATPSGVLGMKKRSLRWNSAPVGGGGGGWAGGLVACR